MNTAPNTIRSYFFIWVGIVGSAFAVFSHTKEFIEFSRWAQFLADNWHKYTHAIFESLFAAIGFKIAPILTPILTFSVFFMSLTFGLLMSGAGVKNYQSRWRSVKTFVSLFATVAIAYYVSFVFFLHDFPSYYILVIAVPAVMATFLDQPSGPSFRIRSAISSLMVLPYIVETLQPRLLPAVVGEWSAIVTVAIFALQVITIAKAAFVDGESANVLLYYALFSVLAFILVAAPLDAEYYRPASGASSVVPIFLWTMTLIWILPVLATRLITYEAANLRIGFILMGVAMLVALSLISRLGIDLNDPPRPPV